MSYNLKHPILIVNQEPGSFRCSTPDNKGYSTHCSTAFHAVISFILLIREYRYINFIVAVDMKGLLPVHIRSS